MDEYTDIRDLGKFIKASELNSELKVKAQNNFPFPPPIHQPIVLFEMREYIVVTDKTSKVVMSSENLDETIRFAGKVRECGGECTIFKATKY